jgi:hypothetical protein
MRAGELPLPLVAAIKRELLAGTYLQADKHQRRCSCIPAHITTLTSGSMGDQGRTGRARCLILRWAVGGRCCISRADAIELHRHVPLQVLTAHYRQAGRKLQPFNRQVRRWQRKGSAISRGSTRHTLWDSPAVLLPIPPQLSKQRRSQPRLKRPVTWPTAGADETSSSFQSTRTVYRPGLPQLLCACGQRCYDNQGVDIYIVTYIYHATKMLCAR